MRIQYLIFEVNGVVVLAKRDRESEGQFMTDFFSDSPRRRDFPLLYLGGRLREIV